MNSTSLGERSHNPVFFEYVWLHEVQDVCKLQIVGILLQIFWLCYLGMRFMSLNF